MKKYLSIMLFMMLGSFLFAEGKSEILVFYKNKKPALKVLKRVKPILKKYDSKYEVKILDIEDEKNANKIINLGLPKTHFPFAIVINGKYSAKIEQENIGFVHFPEFMKGIGRHEGNWSLADLEKVLRDNSLLLAKNELPQIEEEEEENHCEE